MHRVPQGHLRREIKGNCDGWELSLVGDSEGSGGPLELCKSAERDHRARRGLYVDLLKPIRALPETGLNDHHHAVLVQKRVDDGNLTLAEGIIEGIIDHCGGDTEP